MRFVTSAKYLIGFAVASSAVVLLAGSALAAESAHPASTVQQAPALDGQVSGSGTDGPVLGGVATEDSSGNNTVTNSADATIVISTTNTSSTIVGPGTAHPVRPSVPQTAPSVPTVASQGLSKLTDQVVPAAPVAGALPAVAGQALRPDGQVFPETAWASPAGTDEAVVAHAPSVASVVVGDQRLPIQPVITSHVTLPADLAPAIPAAPVRDSLPVPAQSTGLLSALTLGLASTAAASVAAPDAHILIGAADVMPVARLLLGLLLLLAVAGYISRLRQGGFVSAARSDVAAAQLSVATSSLMGYVPARPQNRSPFFVMSEMKIFPVMFVTL